MKVMKPSLLGASVVLALTATTPVDATARARIPGAVHRKLQRQGTVNLMVTMQQDTAPVLESFKHHEASYLSRGEMITALVETLETHASSTQEKVTRLLAEEADGVSASEVRTFWISNQVFFRDATLGLVEKLAATPGVAAIEEEQIFSVPDLKPENTTRISTLAANQWGVEKIGAPAVWAEGFNGAGVVVGSIDTGVLATHTALKSSHRSDYGWYDPVTKTPSPLDQVGHGTHTMGSIVGSGGIGVAPGASWIACRGCATEDCFQSDLLACMQFMLCPTDPSGQNKDCSKAPRVINNSWGGGQGDTAFDSAILAWQQAGIIAVFSNGNTGPRCGTAASPADNPAVIAVGSTNSADSLSSFSSKGPARNGLMKPDVAAPGENVLSAWYTDDAAFEVSSGTSMAAPHVTGVVALLLSARPSLTSNDVRKLLTSSTDQSTLQTAGMSCSGVPATVFPNYHYGYGRVNAHAAYRAAVVLPPPTSAPTPAPTPSPGDCNGLGSSACQSTFFCSWNALQQLCQRWWN